MRLGAHHVLTAGRISEHPHQPLMRIRVEDRRPRAQHPQHLIITGAVEGIIRPGGLISEPGQLGTAGHRVHQHPGRELRRPARVLAREAARRPGLARTAARRADRAQRPGLSQPGRRSGRAGLIRGDLPALRDDTLQVALPRRRVVLRVGVSLLQPPRRVLVGHRVQQGLLLLLRHRVRASHHRLPRHRLILCRLRDARGGIFVPPGVRWNRFRVHAPPPVRMKWS